MTITSKTIAFAILTSAVVFFLWSLALTRQQSALNDQSPAVTNTYHQTQESSEANVSVSLTPRVLFPKEKPEFDVAFETHSVDLTFDVAAIATLVDQNGNALGSPQWDGTPAGGHHRSGTLSFSEPLPLSTKQIILTLSDIAGVAKRTFTWEVKAQ